MAKKKKKKDDAQKQQPKQSGPSILDGLFESRYYVIYFAIFIAVLTVILFNSFVFSDLMLFGSDTLQAGVFFRDFFVDYYKAHGSVPQWNPYIFGGMPFVDAFHGDIFYPISFIFKMIFPLFRALGWVLIFHVFLAGLTMYLCARAFRLGKLSASLAGIMFMFAPYLVSLVAPGHDGKMFVTALFPLTMMFLERGMSTRSYIDFVGLGTVIGLIILTPHPQMAYFSLWAIGSYFLFRLISRYLRERSLSTAGLLSALFVLALVVGLCLSAIQFYPGYRYVKNFSPRAGEGRGGYEWATSWSMHTEELKGMFVPHFQGVNGAEENTYWGRNPFKDNSEYAGILPILLGVIGVLFHKDRRKWYFLALGVFALIYALGGTTPIFYLFYYVVPNVKSMRAPSMIMFLFSFSFSLLAAMGIEWITERIRIERQPKRELALRVLLIATIVYAVLAVLWTIAGEAMMGLYQGIFYSGIAQNKYAASIENIPAIQLSLWLVAFIFGAVYFLVRMYEERKIGLIAIAAIALLSLIDTWRIDSKFIETFDPAHRFSAHPVVQHLLDNTDNHRVFDVTGRMFGSLDYFAYFGLQQVTGYHGNQLQAYDRLIGGLQFSNLIDRQGRPQLPVLNLLGVQSLVYSDRYPMGDTTLLKTYDQYSVAVYRNPHVLPRAFAAHEHRVFSDPDSIIDLVKNERFNPRKYLLLEEEPDFEPAIPEFGRYSQECDLIEYEPGYVKIAVLLKAPAWICLTDAYYPAWRAYVDGEETEVHRAYSALMAAGVPEGEHVLEFVYKSDVYHVSRIVTYLTVLFIAVSIVLSAAVPRFKKEKHVG